MQPLATLRSAVLLLGLILAADRASCAATPAGKAVTLPAAAGAVDGGAAVVALPAAAANVDGGKTVTLPAAAGTVAGSATLVGALRDPAVTHVLLVADYAVGDEFQHFLTTPLAITRNVTLSGQPGLQTPPLLDVEFQQAVLRLCASCSLTLSNVALSNERHGNGAELDFVQGALQRGGAGPSSAVVMRNVTRVRSACLPPDLMLAEFARDTPSSRLGGRSQPVQQQLQLRDTTWQGTLYPQQVFAAAFSEDVPLSTSEEGSAFGGYSLALTDVVYVCMHVVNRSCLRRKNADICVHDVLASAAQPAAAVQQAPVELAAGVNPVAIAVPLAVAGAVLVAAAALGITWARRRKLRLQQAPMKQCAGSDVLDLHDQPPQDPLGPPSPGAGKPVPSARTRGSAVAACGIASDDSAMMEEGRNGSVGQQVGQQGSPQPLQPPRTNWRGWKLYSTATSPLVGHTDSQIELGELLGSGSFGRVYSGRWAGRDVAVKVIEHLSDSSAVVENEVQLQMSFDHPNVVRALHYVSYTRPRSTSRISIMSRSTQHSRGRSGPDQTQAQLSTASSLSDVLAGGTTSTAGGGSTPPPAMERPLLLAGSGPGVAAYASTPNSGRGSAPPCQDAQALSLDQGRQESSDLDCTLNGTDCSGSQAVTAKSRLSMDQAAPVCRAESWIVQELCDAGNMYEVAAEWDTARNCDAQMLERLLLLQDAATGLAALHAANVIHGDLNARNVLVSTSASSPIGLVAKLSDLGLSRRLKQQQTHRTTNTIGTLSHMAPELLRSGHLSAACDVYALGIMAWELYTNQLAFKNLPSYGPGAFIETVVIRGVRPLISRDMPADYALFIQHCWQADAAARPSIGHVLQALQIMLGERQRRLASSTSAAGSNLQQQKLEQGGEGSTASAVEQLAALLGPLPTQQQRWLQPGAQPPRQSSCPEGPLCSGLLGMLDSLPPQAAAPGCVRSEPLGNVTQAAAAASITAFDRQQQLRRQQQQQQQQQQRHAQQQQLQQQQAPVEDASAALVQESRVNSYGHDEQANNTYLFFV